MYITARIGKVSIAMATKDEYLFYDEHKLCSKGFRLQIGNYMWNKGLYTYTGIDKGWVQKCR